MSISVQPKLGRVFIGRFECGDDLLESITAFCRNNKIQLGIFNIIGAVQNAKLGYYDQEKKKYTGCVEFDKKLEITACMGNISVKESDIMAHTHITLAGFDGKAFGGHVMPGTKIFAAEFFIQEFIGARLERGRDEVTGLPLWK